MTKIDPDVVDEAPQDATATAYDSVQMILYLRLLDADAAGADWRDVARVVLGRDAHAEPDRTRKCWETHLARAKWIAANCYQRQFGEIEKGNARDR